MKPQPGAGMSETARGTAHAWQCDREIQMRGHVNVRARSFDSVEFFEEAAWQADTAIGITPSRLRAREILMAAVQQNTSYRRELAAGDSVSVRTAITGIRERVLEFTHELINDESGEVCAISSFTVVCPDPATRRATAFPREVQDAARARRIDYTPPR